MFDKVFQILFLAIMSIGILGLPLYYYLNYRRKRLMSDFEKEQEKEKDNDTDLK